MVTPKNLPGVDAERQGPAMLGEYIDRRGGAIEKTHGSRTGRLTL